MKGATLFLLFLLVIGLPLAAQQATALKSDQPSVTTTRQTWAVVVGISEYIYVDRLRYADKDAAAFYQFLLSPAGGSVPKANITFLTNERATTAQIVKALDNLTALVQSGDRVILYFAGHGDQETRTIAQRGFLLTHDTFSSNYMAGALPVIFFQDYIATFSTKNKANVTVFLDACHAGKLAGNEYGGVQLTGEQLARQVGNETKLMACQTGEISLEGKQWGNGQGAFTYHLIRGLQGLADANGDGQVTLREEERYLEDHVSPEAMPVKQTPFKVGDAGAVLANVDMPTLTALKTNQPLPTFAPVAGRGFVDDVLKKADQQTIVLYRSFQNYLTQKLPQQAIPDYEKLIQQPSLAKVYPFLARDLAATLVDQAQTLLNNYLNSQEQGSITTETCKRLSSQLAYAAKILGPASAFYKPMLARSAFFSGVLARHQKDSLTAFQAFQQANQLDSTAAFVYNEQGIYWIRLNNLVAAEAALRKGLRFAPNWSYLYCCLGVVLADTKRPQEAEETYRKAIALKPDYAGNYYNLGNLLTDLNRFNEAEAAYRKAISLKPTDASFYYRLGRLLNELRRPIEAEAAYRKAIGVNPDYSNAYFYLGLLLEELKRPVEAEAAYRKAVLLKADFAGPYYALGLLLKTKQQLAEAEEYLRKAIVIEPGYAKLYNDLGFLLYDAKRLDEAEVVFRKAIDLKADFAGPYYAVGLLLKNKKQFVEAEALLRKAIEFRPDFAGLHADLGTVLSKANRIEDAETAFRKAIDLKPDYADAYYNLGLLFYNQQNYKEATSQFKRYTELKPRDSDGWHYWGLCSLYLKEFTTTKLCFETVVKLLPDDTSAPYNLACMYSLQNKPTEALVWLEKALQQGYTNFDHIAEDTDLDNIRKTEDFVVLIKKYQKKP